MSCVLLDSSALRWDHEGSEVKSGYNYSHRLHGSILPALLLPFLLLMLMLMFSTLVAQGGIVLSQCDPITATSSPLRSYGVRPN